MSHAAPLQARLASVNDAIKKQQRIRDRAPRGSRERKQAVQAIRGLKKRRRKLRRDRWKMSGATAIVKYEIVPALEAAGVEVTSRKRWATFGNPSSDHWLGNRDADAADGATHSNNDELGGEIKAGLLDDPDATMDGFAEFTIVRSHTGNPETYRVQIITEPHGTGPHIHNGVKRIS